MVRKLNRKIKPVVERIQAAGWTVAEPSGGGYRKAKCPCGDHLRWIHFTPSGGSYVQNLEKWFERQPCWKEPV